MADPQVFKAYRPENVLEKKINISKQYMTLIIAHIRCETVVPWEALLDQRVFFSAVSYPGNFLGNVRHIKAY